MVKRNIGDSCKIFDPYCTPLWCRLIKKSLLQFTVARVIEFRKKGKWICFHLSVTTTDVFRNPLISWLKMSSNHLLELKKDNCHGKVIRNKNNQSYKKQSSLEDDLGGKYELGFVNIGWNASNKHPFVSSH